jgi:hypothetical protein
MTAHAFVSLCPSCATALAARDLVFSETFWVNIWYAVLPFAAAGVVVRAFVRRLDPRGAR